jgi:HAD superfamily hydrolase (TIGR01490 family)
MMPPLEPDASRPIVFFDLDLTLLSENSARLWLRRARRKKMISALTVIQGAAWVSLYHLGFGRIERALTKGVKTLRGFRETDLEKATRDFWDEEVCHTIREEGRRVVQKHQAQGHRCVLLTSSSVYLARIAQQEFELDDILSTVFEVTDGTLTGFVEGEICYGVGKLKSAQRYARAQGVSLKDSTFYTDSYSDLPVLEKVGHPIIVQPDPRLGRHARRQGWPVVTWDAGPRKK